MSGFDWVFEAATNFRALATMLDAGEAALDEVPPVMLHNFYLIASLLYHEWAEPIITDQTFDRICRHILERYDQFKAVVWWPEQTLIPDLLQAGSGFALHYPDRIRGIVCEIQRQEYRAGD